MTVYEACSKCRHEQPYDKFNPKLRMCHAEVDAGGRIHTTEFMRAEFGPCGPDPKLFQLRDTKK